jgi:hypothetical protein
MSQENNQKNGSPFLKMEFSPLLWAFHLLKTHHTLVGVSFFEMPPYNKGKNMSSDMPSKYTKRTPLFTNIRCLPNIIKKFISALQIMVLKADGLHVNIY